MLKKSLSIEFSWKKTFLLLLVCLCTTASLAFADYRITRGPNVGEIYFIGPTATGEGIYHSTDFGKTAACMDSTINYNVISTVADKTYGVLYYMTMQEGLYISYNYGEQGSWSLRNGGVILQINSGRSEGEIYNTIVSHSENYGVNFIMHSYNGFFGNLLESEIDSQTSIGYAITNKTGVLDSLYLMISYDNYDSLETQHVFDFNSVTPRLSRGYNSGELFLLVNNPQNDMGKQLFYSDDYGNTWEQKNTFNCPNLPIRSIVGGRQPGELYMVVEYIQLTYEIAHIYIYHSMDYGEAFTVYHPFLHGPEPYVANFEANPINGTAPLTVQFTDFSTGENLNYWEWDFDNDGVIDSYEQNPEYTYQDTGYYSVSLTIHPLQLDTATRYNYIHIKDPNAIDEEGEHLNIIVNNTPNPFSSSTVIQYTLPRNIREATIDIYNTKGQKIKTLTNNNTMKGGTHDITWDGTNSSNEPVGSGIYFIKLESEKSVHVKKIVKM